MNLKCKLKGVKLLVVILVLANSVACNKDEHILKVFDNSEKLHIQGNLNDPSILMIPKNRVIYNEAFERVLSMTTQHGKSIEIKVGYGAEINISERLFIRISNNLNFQINSGKMVIIKKNGQNILVRKIIPNKLSRLKMDGIELDELIRYLLNQNIALNIMRGMRSYNSSIHGSINDIWDISTGGFAAQNYYTRNGSFTYQGETFYYFMCNGCGNANSNDCNLNDICSSYDYKQPGGRYFFVIDNIQQLPLVSISTDSRNAYLLMLNYMNSSD